ncbi:AbrB/MazE/SpoVT family DNA-binding domain-containing protein [Thiospirochaeta perfilievii]|uniref:AbrB/MazE/SpoVT family DNA-binding domain-containing protein n=1 Tax=Thiospirochaeta perfilievii TaxID=252967 RepID=A0A5C1QA43_9SPIO|nr:AbrB/MazE/SpoVT family DNA-binding domain-containing protein [Thiospirochaeta perfilievii]QEN04351.1 AbrB/MazE/SpoVT family DNA-binding domain-containing protein [Thiospirochaeta perfilievii]
MQISVIPIGNSKGIRIPKNILTQLHIEDSVELEVHNKEILIKPIHKNVREGWTTAFKSMSVNNEDDLLIPDNMDLEESEWEW